MAESAKLRLQAPGGSWESIKKIIRAYDAVADADNPTVEHVATLAGVQRPVVSQNNNFLRSVGILQDGVNKLSALGSRLATGLAVGNASLVGSAIQDLVRAQEGLSHLVTLLRARSSMSVEAFRGEIVVMCGLNAESRNLLFLKTVVDMLQDGMIVKVEDDEISFRGFYVGETTGVATATTAVPTNGPLPPEKRGSGTVSDAQSIPIPLGVGRLVHVHLPEDWSPKDLPKLLKMLELSLGEGEQ
jgi:hypothetical protein